MRHSLLSAAIASGLLFLSASAAQADGTCPELAGNYVCPDGPGGVPLQIAQKMENGIAIFRLGGEILIADGRERPIGDNGDFRGVVKGLCENRTLARGQAFRGSPVWSMQIFSIDRSGNLEIASFLSTPKSRPSEQPMHRKTCLRDAARRQGWLIR